MGPRGFLALLTLGWGFVAVGGANTAHALGTSCGGDDESSSSSDSGSSDDSSSSDDDWGDDDSTSTPHPCAGDSRIVGESRCHRFGGWDVSRRRAWTFGLDVGTLRLGMDDVALVGSAMHDNVPHRWNADELVSGTGVRFALRGRVFLHPNFFMGVEAAVGGVSLAGRIDSASTDVELDSAMAVAGGLIAGGSVGIGNLRLEVEAVAGRRMIVVNGTSDAPDCLAQFSESFGQWTLRGGAGVSYFLRPNFSVGVHARYGFLQREINGALSLTIHSRAYDAR